MGSRPGGHVYAEFRAREKQREQDERAAAEEQRHIESALENLEHDAECEKAFEQSVKAEALMETDINEYWRSGADVVYLESAERLRQLLESEKK